MRIHYARAYSRPGIYRITCLANNTHYIGQAKNVSKRTSEHRQSLRRGDHKNSHLQNSFNKYGEANFEVVFCVFCDLDSLTWYEQRVLDIFRRHYKVFNTTAPVHTPMLGVKRVDGDKGTHTLNKYRDKAIAAFREKVRTDVDFREHLQAVGRASMQRLRANPKVEEKRKIAAAVAQGRPELRKHRRKLMYERIANGWNPSRENAYSIAVTNTETGEVFKSYQAAADKYHVSAATVHRWVNGRRDGRSKNTTGKPNWRLYEKENL